jgi:hypothetical protein
MSRSPSSFESEELWRAPLRESKARGLDGALDVAARRAAPDTEPTVKVTIGRVEVRAILQPAPARERRAPPAPKGMSLEEYLERRHGRRR